MIISTKSISMADYKGDIAVRLKTARRALGVSSGEFAKKSNIDPRNYSSIETGKRSVGERVLKDICTAFPLNLNWLTTGTGEMLNKETPIEVIQPSVISIPTDAWEVIKNQAASLKAKDEQMVDVIQMLREQLNKKTDVRPADNAECADVAG